MATIVCQNCGIRTAAVELHQPMAGGEAVVRLCHHCASAIAAGTRTARSVAWRA